MESLNRQVGGNHYQTMRHQPVELTASYGLSGFEHSAVKYASRQKGARLEDLRKGVHFCEFAIEAHPRISMFRPASLYVRPTLTAEQYCVGNGLGPLESKAIQSVCEYALRGDLVHLQDARAALLELIHAEKLEEGAG